MNIVEQAQEMAASADRAADLKQQIDAAGRAANRAAGDLSCARSWVGFSEVEDDDRDPNEMFALALERAEKNASEALAKIRDLRSTVTLVI